MNQAINILISTDRYANSGLRVQARFLYIILGILSILFASMALISFIDGNVVLGRLLSFAFVAVIVAYLMTRYGYMTLASWSILTLGALLSTWNTLNLGRLESYMMIASAFLIVLSGFLLRERGLIVFTLFAMAQMIIAPNFAGLDDLNRPQITRYIIVALYGTLGVIVFSFNQVVIASRREGEDIAGRERMKLADVNMQITRQAATRVSLDEALNNTLALILENYPQLYHAQVFLIDADGVQAELWASTGEPGRILLERNHSLPVGSLSVIGQTTLAGEPVVAIANDPNSVHKVNELLKDTTLEAAFPLRVEDRIIGALDLQSKTLNVLSDDDRISFQSLANSLSLAIDNIRQFAAAQARIDENERLTERTRVMLNEVERLNRRLIGRAWAEYTAEHDNRLGYEVNLADGDIQSYNEWSTSLQSAIERGEMTRTGDVIAVPLRIRGEIVGAMEFELEGDLSDEQAMLIEEVTERFGLAAENTRLVEESQRTAHRETLINQITSRFQASQNVESTLTEAARSLSETLSAEKVMIRLGLPDNAKQNGHRTGEDN